MPKRVFILQTTLQEVTQMHLRSIYYTQWCVMVKEGPVTFVYITICIPHICINHVIQCGHLNNTKPIPQYRRYLNVCSANRHETIT